MNHRVREETALSNIGTVVHSVARDTLRTANDLVTERGRIEEEERRRRKRKKKKEERKEKRKKSKSNCKGCNNIHKDKLDILVELK